MRVVRTDGCWFWTGAKSKGYGQFKIDGRFRSVHRWAYEEFNGPVPGHSELHHLCGVKHCVRPSHLIVVTSQEHHDAHAPTHCTRGHEFTPDNTYIARRTGKRQCRACWTVRRDKRRAKGEKC